MSAQQSQPINPINDDPPPLISIMVSNNDLPENLKEEGKRLDFVRRGFASINIPQQWGWSSRHHHSSLFQLQIPPPKNYQHCICWGSWLMRLEGIFRAVVFKGIKFGELIAYVILILANIAVFSYFYEEIPCMNVIHVFVINYWQYLKGGPVWSIQSWWPGLWGTLFALISLF